MKNPLFFLVGIALLVLIAGGYVYPKLVLNSTENTPTVASPVGSTFGTAKIASVNMTPSTGSATTTSILNTDASDRIVTGGFYSCSGIGTSYTAYTGAGLTSTGVLLFAATTTTAALSGISQTNAAFLTTFATTSDNINIASSSTNGAASFMSRWKTGTYMTFVWNATNTAACTVGVSYLAT